MDDMARYPGLVRRKARWYLRSRIPADLTDFLKRAEVWRSLGTVEFRAAVGRYDVVDLPKAGIRGNSHMIMMDRNSDQVAGVIQAWLEKQGMYR